MSAAAQVRVLLVDDSPVARRILRDAFEADGGFEIIGEAEDPFLAHESIFRDRPDVVVLDVQLPRMDGLTFLGKLMHHHPLPVVVHSSLTQADSPQAVAALALGAVDAVPKPRSIHERRECMTRLLRSVRAAAASRPIRAPWSADDSEAGRPTRREPAAASGSESAETAVRAIGIAASTGGTQAIESVVRQLPGDAPCILVVQHLPSSFVESFATRLDERCAASVRVAEPGERLERGCVLIAPGDRHLSVDEREGWLTARVSDAARVNYHRPSADVLFSGLARHAAADAIGIVLTGMGGDGAAGLLELRRAGAHTMAQSERSCVVYGMPRAAVELGAVVEVVDLDRVHLSLERALRRRAAAPCS